MLPATCSDPLLLATGKTFTSKLEGKKPIAEIPRRARERLSRSDSHAGQDRSMGGEVARHQ